MTMHPLTLVSYTSVKGCIVIRPYGYEIWENKPSRMRWMFSQIA